jgi:hypothetical protein
MNTGESQYAEDEKEKYLKNKVMKNTAKTTTTRIFLVFVALLIPSCST